MKLVILVVGLLFCILGYQNCAPVHDKLGGENSGSSIDPSVTAFSANLHNTLIQSCGGCHGNSQAPLFAVSDAKSAHDMLIQGSLVNDTSPQSSRIVTKVNSGHQGFGPTEGGAIEFGIRNWFAAIEDDSNNGGGGGPTPTPTPVNTAATFTEVHQQIVPKCLNCHQPGGIRAGTDYTNHATTIATGGVVAGNSFMSSLYIVCADESMPQGGTPLSNTEKDMIRTWIDSGAPNN